MRSAILDLKAEDALRILSNVPFLDILDSSTSGLEPLIEDTILMPLLEKIPGTDRVAISLRTGNPLALDPSTWERIMKRVTEAGFTNLF